MSSPAPFVSTPCFCIRLLERRLRAEAALLAFSRLEIRSRISSAESIITSAPFFSWSIAIIIEAGDELLCWRTRS
ncbi:hypothetical protein PtrEW7m1_011952, partial [Pyrenophora tritici-repentis]